jgi:hypothetical protein
MTYEFVQPANSTTMPWSSVWLDAVALFAELKALLVQGKRRRLSGFHRAARVRVEAPCRRLITICAWCKKVRNSEGVWRRLQAQVQAYTNAEFTHGICPTCAEQSYNAYCYLSVKRSAVTPAMLALQ